jgi:hypothetical protein
VKTRIKDIIEVSAVATGVAAVAGAVFLFAIHWLFVVVLGIPGMGAWFSNDGLHVFVWIISV